MSSSVFSESPVSTNELRMNDSNLVVVYGKNGVNNVEGLECLMDAKANSTISVVRLTSPTPSMKEEDEKNNESRKSKKDDEKDKSIDEELNTDDEVKRSEKDSDTQSDDGEQGADDDTNETPKVQKKLLKEKPESVGLIIEDFLLPERTKEITKAALTLSGLKPLTVSVDFEIQVKALQNDHCYTPLTSPSQLNNIKPEPKPIPSSAISAATLAKAAQKMAAIKAKNAAARAAAATEKLSEQDIDKKRSTEDFDDNETAEDENESDYSESEESADTDNDRDSDLDFNVNDRTGRRRRSNKKVPKRKMKNKILRKRQSVNSDFNSSQEEDKKSLITKTNRGSLDKLSNIQTVSHPVAVSIGGSIYKTSSIKQTTVQSPSKTNIIASKAEIKPQNRLQLSSNSQIIKINQSGQQSDVVSNIITGTGKPSGDPSGKPVVQNVVIIKPPNKKPLSNTSGGFTDITKYLSKTENLRTSNVQVCELIKPDSSGAIVLRRQPTDSQSPQRLNSSTIISSPNQISKKGFMPLIPDKSKCQQLPAQISVQIQDKSNKEKSQKDIENQEEMDIIDSIVGQIQCSEQVKANGNTNQINVVFDNKKVSEKQPVSMHSDESHSTFTTSTNQVDPVDISNAPLLETADEIPEDLIKDMAELIDHKTLQELVAEQQQQQLQSQQLNQHMNVTDFESNIPKTYLLQSAQANDSQNECHIDNMIKRREDETANQIGIKNVNQSDESNDIDIKKYNESILKDEHTTPIQQPVQVVSKSGRVITLPPIEAPTTRAKRRAAAGISIHQDTPTPPISSNVSEASESEYPVTPKSSVLLSKQQKETNTPKMSKDLKKKLVVDSTKKPKRISTTEHSHAEESINSQDESSQEEDEDDPNKLWCICRQPHNNRFMICCDSCEDWFHGTCVGVTKSMGKEMETHKIDWTCPNCKDGKKQQTIKQMFDKQSSEAMFTPNRSKIKTAATDKKEKNQNSIKKIPQRKSTDIPLISSISTPLSKSMQQKISEIIGVPLPEPKIQTVSEHIEIPQPINSPQVSNQKKKSLQKPLKIPVISKPKSDKVPSSTKKKDQSKSKESETESISSIEKNQKDSSQNSIELEAVYCIVCKTEEAKTNSIYCSDDCIRKHAQNALACKATKQQVTSLDNSQILSTPDSTEKKKKQPSSFEEALGCALIPTPKKIERISVFERKSGKILTGNSAPTATNLKRWLQENPTFEVVLPGSIEAEAIEKNKLKQKVQTIIMSPESQQRSMQSYRQNTPRSQSQQKHVIKILKSISSNPSPKGDYQPQEINEISHKPVTQKALVLQQISPSKADKSEIKLDSKSENVEMKLVDKTKGEKIEKIEKRDKQQNIDRSPTKIPLKKQYSREKERDRDSDREKPQSSEPIRLNVKRTLKEKLLTRLAEITEENHPRLSESECESFANETEEEMFDYFHRDTGVKYKAKYRSLAFNIKDHKNKTLFRKICEKVIEPKQLVRMTPEELASQELAQWRENENKHQLEMIKKSELDLLSCAKNYVLKTHKGEEVIEDKLTDRVNLDITIPVEDVVTVLNNSTVSSTSEIEKNPNLEMLKRASQESDIDSSLGNGLLKNENLSFELNQFSSEVDEDKKIEIIKTKTKEKIREKHNRNKDRHREKDQIRNRSRSRSRDRKHRKTSQGEDNRSHNSKVDDKEKVSYSPNIESTDLKCEKELYENDESENHSQNSSQAEQEEELHGFDETANKIYNQLLNDGDKIKNIKDEKVSNNEESEKCKEREKSDDHEQSALKHEKKKSYHHSHHRKDDRSNHHDRKQRSYTHSPSIEDEDDKRKRHHTSHHSSHHSKNYHHHQHHQNRSSPLASISSPSIDSEESRKELNSKTKTDSKSSLSTPTSTTVLDVSGNLKKHSTVGSNHQSSNKASKPKSFNQKPKIKNFKEYSLIDKIFAESEKTIEEAANLVPSLVGKEKSLVKPADSQSSLNRLTSENNDLSTETKEINKFDSSGNDSEQELPSSTVTIPTPPEDPYFAYASDTASILWTGNINMIDVATFNVILQPLSGNFTNIDKEFPVELDVVGRIGPDTVWDYIGKIKKSPNKEIVLVRLVPSPESETNAYTALYQYLDKRKRLGVVKSTSPGIKDFYILPLNSKNKLPIILQTPINSEVLDDDSRPDLLIGILIRIMDFGHLKRHSIASTSVTSVSIPDAVTKIVRKPMNTVLPTSKLRSETTVIKNKKIGLGDSNDLLEEEDYKPESPHMNLSGTNVFNMLTAKTTESQRDKIRDNKEIYIGEDADEPYSPGGSSEDDVNSSKPMKTDDSSATNISNTANLSVSADELQRKVEELTRQIEKEKKEIETLGTVAMPQTSNELAPTLANISIPSNLQQILASIKKPDSRLSSKLIEDDSKKSTVINLDEDEYNPEDAFYDIKSTGIDSNVPTMNAIQKPSTGGSRLANLSEAELLQMVPDNIDLTENNSNSNSKLSLEHISSPPPPKKSRWDIDPPPPGLEDEYEE